MAESGRLAAINYVGYLSGALLASFISDLRLKDLLYRWGIVLVVASTILVATTTHFWIRGISVMWSAFPALQACCWEVP
ncbi:YbfB/YjiJ family MFS transporter [Halopseudomonas pelagia]|uniref:Uncharacterized protein n=1 Tax=Halopseudomonas pelagia TaxID=553151 RepID=A0AA91U2T3_9GAMM|nr:YbfB/YjiJ family MFS transporter [Halopseudomonas pelagia]PCC99684.1 hypothetical protein CO192_09570 [Halopseudomonas pelagia]